MKYQHLLKWDAGICKHSELQHTKKKCQDLYFIALQQHLIDNLYNTLT